MSVFGRTAFFLITRSLGLAAFGFFDAVGSSTVFFLSFYVFWYLEVLLL